jgi:glycosyltransferase involved in cell wall biosynthesis
MRILAITNVYPTESSPGRGVFIHEQIKSLRAIGLETHVVYVDRLREGPAAYYRMGAGIEEALRGFDPDLIHVMYGGVMARRVVSRHHARPVLVTFHGSDLLGENLSGWKRKAISRYGVWCSRSAARGAEGVIVVARHLLKALPRKVAETKARVLPCGIDLERFKPAETAACRSRLGWTESRFHVLFASSNGDPVKRPWLAKAAVAELARRGIPAELHCMSGVPSSDVPLWLNGSDALLLTSVHEGSPTVVKEALACGLPVVSVDVGDVAERIQGIVGCHLARPEPADLAAKLLRVRQHSRRIDCRERLGEISTASIARRLRALYEDLTQGASPAAETALTPARASR